MKIYNTNKTIYDFIYNINENIFAKGSIVIDNNKIIQLDASFIENNAFIDIYKENNEKIIFESKFFSNEITYIKSFFNNKWQK